MRVNNEIPIDAEATVVSVRWAVQSRANEGDPWRNENDNTPALTGEFELAARKLLRVYRQIHPERESRLSRQTMACFGEPVET